MFQGHGLRHVASAEVEEVDEGAVQEEENTAAAQAAECGGATLCGAFPGGVLCGHYLYLQEETWGELRGLLNLVFVI